VFTDQRSLWYLLEHKKQSQDLLAKLLGYEFDTVYKPGTSNKVVDRLSRSMNQEEGEGTEVNLITKPYWSNMKSIEEEVKNDPVL